MLRSKTVVLDTCSRSTLILCLQREDQAGSSRTEHGENDQVSAQHHLHHPGTPYGQMGYFDPGTGMHHHAPQHHQHSIPMIPEGSTMAGNPIPIKSSENGSPPPNSATTTDSTSTPTSVEGLSSSEGKTKSSDSAPDFPREGHLGIPSVPLQPKALPGSDWLSGNLVGQQYDHPPTSIAGDIGESYPESTLSHEENNTPNPYPSAIKLLVSNNVAGSIIGRAGQTISEFQDKSSARIKLSQTGDFYPGTQDRVCLVQGQLENVKAAVKLLLERLYMLQEQSYAQQLTWQSNPEEEPASDFDFIVRLLVPSSSCGMIIGKAGSNIKSMEEASGVSSVRLSPKEFSDPSSPTASLVAATAERIVTLTGSKMANCFKCLSIILDNMMSNQDICKYSNMTTSYSRLVPQNQFSVPPSGRPIMMVPPGANPEHLWDTQGPYAPLHFMGGKRNNSSPDLPGIMMWDQRAGQAMPPPDQQGQMPRNIQGDAMPPYSPSFIEGSPSFSQDMNPVVPSPSRGPPSTPPGQQLYGMQNPSPTPMDPTGMSSSVSAPDLLAIQMQDSLRISPATIPGGADYPHFVPQMPQPTPPGFTAHVLVPDSLIGSILGRAGRTLNELQMHSNTRIRISQRGEFAPGTKNRIVTIRGPTAQSVSLAQYLMNQRMIVPPTASFSSQPPPPHAPFPPPQALQPRPVQQQHPASYQQAPMLPPHDLQYHPSQLSGIQDPMMYHPDDPAGFHHREASQASQPSPTRTNSG
jgi:RNA-binding protein Nova